MAREYFAGMGQAVADRTINRKGERWADVAHRVALGNAAITGESSENLKRHLLDASILMSGRHLQHGDETQKDRNIEVFSNCSSICQRSIGFYLLLNGSGTGGSFDDAICIVDFRNMPKVVCTHKDHAPYVTTEQAMVPGATVFMVPDSREGWAEAIEQIEIAAWEGHRDETLILDFSDVRPNGSPIKGMQGRPASGPGPLMDSITRIAAIRDKANWKPWRQALQIDHELADCVLVGGARRAARIAIKNWKDPDILEFINCKREGGLWSANHSIGVDAEFWALKENPVLEATLAAQYQHGTGEPGFLNLDMLCEGESDPTLEEAMNLGGKYHLSDKGRALREALYKAAMGMKYRFIVNPCGEIRLHVSGAYCVIADNVPYFAANDADAISSFKETTKALLRTNLLPALYQGEVNRTNRIGVGMTGLHEYAFARFGLNYRDLLEEGDETVLDANGFDMKAPSAKALPFWSMISDFADAVEEAAADWCWEYEVEFPSTLRTMKPAGTTSKLFGLTEGAHLPPMREYLRWVQFRSDDPLLEGYREQGYPIRELTTYSGTTIVGFPTQLIVCTIGAEIVTAAEATPEEQFRWVRLLETYWLKEFGGNQISYTLKYDPKVVSEADYVKVVMDHMPKVRAISVMPFQDMTAYEYQPEEPISSEAFAALVRGTMKEEIDRVHVDCSSGACPINFVEREAA
jgi:adenosylcobalamin-dependent ribonucleoside-triphosphate reductase